MRMRSAKFFFITYFLLFLAFAVGAKIHLNINSSGESLTVSPAMSKKDPLNRQLSGKKESEYIKIEAQPLLMIEAVKDPPRRFDSKDAHH